MLPPIEAPPAAPPPALAPVTAPPATPPFPTAAPPPPAPVVQAPLPVAPAPASSGRSPLLDEHDRDSDERHSKEWMLAIEGFTRVPIDMGIQAGVEFPIGLRASVGYGFIPSMYLGVFTNAAAGNSSTRASLLRSGIQGGQTWRLQAGIRPFRSLGLYLDAGYSHVSLDGSFPAELLRTGTGDYVATVNIDTWLLELGYQGWLGRHFTFAGALGLTGALSSTSELSGPGLDAETADKITETADQQIEDYGLIPTLTLRLGFDVI
jgi:hypothetical protein